MPTLSQEDANLKILFDMSVDMLCIAGIDGYFKKINPSFSRTLGYAEEEILSKPFYDFIHIDDIEATQLEMGKSINGEVINQFENRYRCKNGQYKSFSWSAQADVDRKLVYAIARDVTEEREAKNVLIQIQNALNSESIVAYTDRAGRITEVNDNFCQISGYSREELIGQNHRLVSSGNHSEDFFRDMWKTISSGKTWSGMIENRRKSGDHYFVQSIITPIFDIQGKIQNYLAVRFDTTEHVKNEVELDKTLSILRETSAIAKVGGWELEVATGELTWTNETFKILEVKQRHYQSPILPEGLDLFVEAHKPIIEKAVQRAIEFGEPYNLELKALTAEGNILWINTTGKPNYENGKIVSLSGTIQDIDARKKAELKYALERQKSIQNSKLAALGELAAGIAHEINNPLAIIHGSVQLMPRYLEDSEKLIKKIDDINNSSKRISHIVKSLQKFSRTSDGKQFSLHCLKDIVDEAVTLTGNKSKRHSTSISVDCNAEMIIICNEIEIEQVIINLINNAIDAIKHLPERWISIDIFEKNTCVVFKITDSGSGIPEEVSDKLFDPFFTTKNVGDGTGLGLSIAKGILDEHNATIAVEQNSPHTCFTIEFQKSENVN